MAPPGPRELKELQTSTGQEMGLRNVDLSNARIALMGNHLVISTESIPGIPGSWKLVSSGPRFQGPSEGAIPTPATAPPSNLVNNSKNG